MGRPAPKPGRVNGRPKSLFPPADAGYRGCVKDRD
jgi:hypothetical protein